MNPDEIVAQKFLMSLKIGNPIFEPDGKVPPDFAIDTLAIEVRRLNQNYFGANKVEGLERGSIAIKNILKEALLSFDSRYDGNSYWIRMEYKRPFKDSFDKIKRRLKNTLKKFLESDKKIPVSFQISQGFTIQIFERNTSKKGELFRFGIGSDRDMWGFVSSIMIDNILFCIGQKSTKIKPYKEKYGVWWLLLINHIIYPLDQEDVTDITENINNLGEFEKVIIIEPTSLNKIELNRYTQING